MALVKCNCGQLILVNVLGTDKRLHHYDNRGNCIAECPKCGKKLSNK